MTTAFDEVWEVRKKLLASTDGARVLLVAISPDFQSLWSRSAPCRSLHPSLSAKACQHTILERHFQVFEAPGVGIG